MGGPIQVSASTREDRRALGAAAFARYHSGERDFLRRPTREASSLIYHLWDNGDSVTLGRLARNPVYSDEVRMKAINAVGDIVRGDFPSAVRRAALTTLEELAKTDGLERLRGICPSLLGHNRVSHANGMLGPLYQELSNGLSRGDIALRTYAASRCPSSSVAHA